MLIPAPDPDTTTLADVQASMDAFVASRGWYRPQSKKPQTPRNLAASVSLEAGEVVECFQWSELADADEVGAELADVVLYAAQLANVMGIDLGAAVAQKFELNETRFEAVRGEQWTPLAS